MFGRKKRALETTAACLKTITEKQQTELQKTDIALSDRIKAAIKPIKENTLDETYIDAVKKAGQPEPETRRTLVFPFFAALGYNTSDAKTFKGEYRVSTPTGDRLVDFAIAPSNKDSSKPTILLETKSYKTDLSKDWHRHPHNGEKEYPKEQLACYYDNTPDAELGILTNGFEYWFFGNDCAATISGEHRMETEPFLKYDIRVDEVPDEFEALFCNSFDMKKVKAYIAELKPLIQNKLTVSSGIIKELRSEIIGSDSVSDDDLKEWFIEALQK